MSEMSSSLSSSPHFTRIVSFQSFGISRRRSYAELGRSTTGSKALFGVLWYPPSCYNLVEFSHARP